jgi:hypothetical protein
MRRLRSSLFGLRGRLLASVLAGRRLARTAGGEVHAQPSEAGARFVVRLPAAAA